MFPLHMRQRVSALSASVAEPTVAGRLYAGATLMVAMGNASSVGRDPRSQSGRLLVSTTQSYWVERTARMPLSSPLVKLSVTPVKVGTCSWYASSACRKRSRKATLMEPAAAGAEAAASIGVADQTVSRHSARSDSDSSCSNEGSLCVRVRVRIALAGDGHATASMASAEERAGTTHESLTVARWRVQRSLGGAMRWSSGRGSCAAQRSSGSTA